jgi:hypothetical protein
MSHLCYVLYFIFYGTLIVKTHPTMAFAFVRTEATDPLTYTVTAFEFFVLQNHLKMATNRGRNM